MAARSAALKIKTKLEEFVRNQKDALSAEVKNIIEKARSDLQELVDEVTGDLQSSAHDLESKITKIEKQHETLKKEKGHGSNDT
jgi:division protein CdvB (Snf7/Vps24/ESCRT-III family)